MSTSSSKRHPAALMTSTVFTLHGYTRINDVDSYNCIKNNFFFTGKVGRGKASTGWTGPKAGRSGAAGKQLFSLDYFV